ncbi:hypothetical protein T492DRAFT_1097836, partial [Pavlovales sp. CCMP2436]
KGGIWMRSGRSRPPLGSRTLRYLPRSRRTCSTACPSILYWSQSESIRSGPARARSVVPPCIGALHADRSSRTRCCYPTRGAGPGKSCCQCSTLSRRAGTRQCCRTPSRAARTTW